MPTCSTASGVTRLCYCGPVLHTRHAAEWQHAPAASCSSSAPRSTATPGLEADLEILDIALECLGVGGVCATSCSTLPTRASCVPCSPACRSTASAWMRSMPRWPRKTAPSWPSSLRERFPGRAAREGLLALGATSTATTSVLGEARRVLPAAPGHRRRARCAAPPRRTCTRSASARAHRFRPGRLERLRVLQRRPLRGLRRRRERRDRPQRPLRRDRRHIRPQPAGRRLRFRREGSGDADPAARATRRGQRAVVGRCGATTPGRGVARAGRHRRRLATGARRRVRRRCARAIARWSRKTETGSSAIAERGVRHLITLQLLQQDRGMNANASRAPAQGATWSSWAPSGATKARARWSTGSPTTPRRWCASRAATTPATRSSSDGVKTALQLIPSGIMRHGVACFIGNGVVVDPAAPARPRSAGSKRWASTCARACMVSESCPLVLPFHVAVDKAREMQREAERRGQDRHHRQGHRAGLRRQGRAPGLAGAGPEAPGALCRQAARAAGAAQLRPRRLAACRRRWRSSRSSRWR